MENKELKEREKNKWENQVEEICKKNKIDLDSKGYDKLATLGVDDYFRILIPKLNDFIKTDEEDIVMEVGPVKIYANKKIDPEIKKNKEKEKIELENIRETCLKFEYNKRGEITGVKVLISVLVDFLLKKYNFKTIFESKSETIFVFHEGIYIKNGREVIQTQTEKILGEHCTNHYVKEIEEKVKRLTAISRDEFDEIPEDLICLENGILNLRTLKLEKYNPNYYFKTKIPLKYNPEAKCLKIMKVLEEIVYPEYIPTIQEWFGFNLYRKYFIKKAMILFGKTDTGKTQILNLLIKFVGEKNKCGISLQKIASGSSFVLRFLKDKHSNIRDDLSSNDIIAGGEFKAATGGSYVTAEYKFGDTFEFLTFAKHLFATNKIPKMKDDDDVFYSRCIPIPFDNPIPEEKQDPFILKKITTKEEMSGLLNWALEGLKRLFENNTFSFNKSDKEIKNLMERDSEPLAAFVQDCLTKDDGFEISKEVMFETYSKYCEIKGLPRLSKEQLGRRLPVYAEYIIAKGGKERHWANSNILCINDDTFDTFLKNLRDECPIGNSLYKNLKKVSKVSQEKAPKSDLEIFENHIIESKEKGSNIKPALKRAKLRQMISKLKDENADKEIIEVYEKELEKEIEDGK